MKRKICVITGTRAEYGLLKPLLNEIKRDRSLRLQLLVTGMHLSSEFGLTINEIKKDGFNIEGKIDIGLKSDSSSGILDSMSIALKKFPEAFEELKPDIIVILGDRFEIFCAVVCALIMIIPIAHISGGELTEGVFDNSLRHSITKMSHLHFTTTKIYRKRVIQLGEQPKTVFNVGALNLDGIKKTKLLTKKELEKEIGFKLGKHNLLVTFHPATLENDASGKQFKNLLGVLDGLKETKIIFTKANADTNGKIINKMIDGYVSRHAEKAVVFASMGQRNYLSTMRFVDAVVGNSSSGIVEAPQFKVATINIGDRQRGRIRTKSIIDCSANIESIKKSFKRLYSRNFQASLKNIKNIYGNGYSSAKIKKILKNYKLENCIKKTFFDINKTTDLFKFMK